MIWKSPAALGLLCLFAGHAAMAASDVDPYLPRCKPAHEARVPVATWDVNDGKLASLRHLMSTWPSGAGRVIYASFGALKNDVQIEDQDKGFLVKITIEGKESEAGEIKVSASERPQVDVGYYQYWGFFEVSPLASPTSEIAFRRLDTFDVVSSARYCLGSGAPQVAARESPAPRTTQSGSLPVCRQGHESRIPIATWKPTLTPARYGGFDVHVAPPAGNGRIVYISIEDPKSSCDAVLSDNGLYSVSLRNRPGSSWPGIGINLRGNGKPVGSGCRYEGFYMNEPAYGMHQGWTETYFGAIDRDRIVASNQYCMAR